MVTTAASAVFVDTNVLVYSKLQYSPLRDAAAERLRSLEASREELWISRQTLREYLSAMTREGTLTGQVDRASLVGDVRHFADHFQLAEDDAAVTEQLLALVQQFSVAGKQIHDANIVATMQAYGVGRLLTHNRGDFARYSSIIEVLPLVP